MHRKPDMIRTIVLIFAIGLAITGFASLQVSEQGKRPDAGEPASEAQTR